jgi:hypothetical protein
MRYPGVIIRLKSYCHDCGGRGVPCHAMSPHGLIPPPIKRSRILVSDGVKLVISVNLYVIKSVAATLVAARTLSENSRFPTSPDQSNNHHFRLFTTGLSLLLFQFQLITSGFSLYAFHSNFFVLCLTINRFDS